MTGQSVERTVRGVIGFLLVLLASLILQPRAHAQTVGSASIRGQVVDESGAGIPGATITVSSPALQLRERTVVTDQGGGYQLNDLPLGVYTVRFELPGFQNLVREDVRLSAGFEARIDATLRVSTVQETVTVTGASPVIDLSTTTVSANLNRELLDAIPTSRSLGEAIAMAPGVRYAGAIDVGGNRTGQFANGGSNFGSSQQSPFLEGINTRLFEGGSMAYLDSRALDEIQVSSVGSSAEFPTPGVAWTAIVKSGGNDFHGLFSYDGQDKALQSQNVDAALEAQGIERTGNSIDYYWDFTAQLGGRIIPDKLWFFAALRDIRRVSNELGFSKDPGLDGSYGTADDVPGTRTMNNPGQTLKLSYQPVAAHRLIGFFTRSIKNEVERGADFFVPRESTWDYFYDPKPWKLEYQWTGSRIFVNTMGGSSSYLAKWRPQAELPGRPITTDIDTGFATGPAPSARNPNRNYQLNAAVTYLPQRELLGSHELKTGIQYFWSIYGVNYPDRSNGNYIRVLDAGAAYRIRTEDRPVEADARMDNPNMFIVDTWRLSRRLTANVGLRFEHHDLRTRGGVKGASEFGVPATYSGIDVATWTGVAPRAGLAWDLFGTGRTVLKGQWGRYLHMASANYALDFSEATVTVTDYTWHDLNGDLLYQPGEVNLDPNGPDYQGVAQRSGASGISAAARPIPNPDLGQPHTDEASFTLEQELAGGLAFRGLLVYKRVVGDYGNRNILRPIDLWNRQLQRQDPGPDGRLLTSDDGGMVTLWDFDTRYRGIDFERNQPINRDGDHIDTYRGFELTLTKRQSRGWSALGSFQMVRNRIWLGNSATPSSPNDLVFPLNETWDWSGKLMGSYAAPWDLQVSGLYNFLAGAPQRRTYTFRSIPGAGSITLPLEPIGAQRNPAQHVVNTRVARSLPLGGSKRLQLSLQLFNVFNANTATTVRYVSGATYHQISEILPPRVARFGVEFSF
jgi:outer membrane receptor protein involved in Fe transport